jgi:hypothetical protein
MKYLIVILFSMSLLGCQTVKEKASAMGEFFEALGNGDIEFFKKQKKTTEDDNKSWEEIK